MTTQNPNGDKPQKKNPDYAQPDQPTYRPPETQPEPRPVDPVMNKKTSSNQPSLPTENPNTKTPA